MVSSEFAGVAVAVAAASSIGSLVINGDVGGESTFQQYLGVVVGVGVPVPVVAPGLMMLLRPEYPRQPEYGA